MTDTFESDMAFLANLLVRRKTRYAELQAQGALLEEIEEARLAVRAVEARIAELQARTAEEAS